MKQFLLSESTNTKVMSLLEAMNKLDEVRDLLGEAFGDDDDIMDVLCELGTITDTLIYLNEDLHTKEFEIE